MYQNNQIHPDGWGEKHIGRFQQLGLPAVMHLQISFTHDVTSNRDQIIWAPLAKDVFAITDYNWILCSSFSLFEGWWRYDCTLIQNHDLVRTQATCRSHGRTKLEFCYHTLLWRRQIQMSAQTLFLIWLSSSITFSSSQNTSIHKLWYDCRITKLMKAVVSPVVSAHVCLFYFNAIAIETSVTGWHSWQTHVTTH